MPTRKNEARWIEARERWQINVQQDGERRTFTSKTPGKKGKVEAERKADAWMENRISVRDIRYEQFYAEFLEEVKNTTGTANYKKHEQIGRLWLLPRLRRKRLRQITEQDYQNCINAAFRKGLSKKSCCNVRASITASCRYAKKRRLLEHIPDMLTIPHGAPIKEKAILQPNDLKKLFSIDTMTVRQKNAPAFYIHAWRFIVLTGFRRGECCGLQWDDLHGDVLTIRRSINSLKEVTYGKNDNARRAVVLPALALNELREQRQMLLRRGILSPWIFPDRWGEQGDPNLIYKQWVRYRAEHDISPCTLHELRHTMISIAKADVPEELLKRAIGHSKSMDTFGVYGHEVEGEGKRVAGILDRVFSSLLA